SSRRRHTRFSRDWSSDVCSSDLFIVGSLIDRISGGGARVQTIINDRRQVSPADFELNLLSLCSIVIKADGTVNQNELHYVRNYRSEERRVGKECRSRRLLSHEKK